MPAVLVIAHGPFCWGSSALEAAHTAWLVEEVACMAFYTVTLNPSVQAIPDLFSTSIFFASMGPQPITGRSKSTNRFDRAGLPNEKAYQETCASIGMMMWNYRMFKLSGDGRYADLVEHLLYNAVLPGVSFSGDTFCYVNPLYSSGNAKRYPWFSVPCCPTNVVRVLPSLGRYIYSRSEDGLWVNLYIQGSLESPLFQGGTALQGGRRLSVPSVDSTVDTTPLKSPLGKGGRSKTVDLPS